MGLHWGEGQEDPRPALGSHMKFMCKQSARVMSS